MASYDDLSERAVETGRRDIAPLIDELAGRLGVEGEDRQAVADTLAKAWQLGLHAGVVETVAQVSEAGVDVRLNINPPARLRLT